MPLLWAHSKVAFTYIKIEFFISLFVWVGFIIIGSLHTANDICSSNESSSLVFSLNYILGNNIICILQNLIGVSSFGFGTIISIAYSGFLTGAWANELIDKSGIYVISKYTVLHSIEYFGFLISGGVGLKGFSILINVIRNKKVNWYYVIKNISLLSFLSLLITFIAALIEFYLSPYV